MPGLLEETKGSLQLLPGDKIVLFPHVLPGNVNQDFLTFVVHSLTVQSNDDVTNRCEKSIGPTAMWQLIPVTGPWWPSKTSPIPALLHKDHTRAVSVPFAKH